VSYRNHTVTRGRRHREGVLTTANTRRLKMDDVEKFAQRLSQQPYILPQETHFVKFLVKVRNRPPDARGNS